MKAANTRHAAPLFADLARTYLIENTDRDVAARTVAIKLAELYDVLYVEPVFMSWTDSRTSARSSAPAAFFFARHLLP